MEMESFITASLILIACLLFAVSGYKIGFLRAGKSFETRSGLEKPGLRDVTVRGTYRTQKRSIRVFTKKLKDYFKSSGSSEFAAEKDGENRIVIRRLVKEGKEEERLRELAGLNDVVPAEMFLSFSTEDNETVIDAECRPGMYLKITSYGQSGFEASSVKQAQEGCSQFMNRVLVEALGAAPVRGPEPELVRALEETVLIRNTPAESQINEKIRDLILNAKQKILVADWIDRELFRYLKNAKGKRKRLEVRVITKDPRGAGKAVKLNLDRLSKIVSPVNVRVNSRFSDRFIVCDTTCIIGSPSLASAGKTRYESAICTNDPNVVRGLETHFEEIWNDEKSKRPKV